MSVLSVADSSLASQYYQIYTPQPISCFFIPFTLNGEVDMDVADKARQTILPLIESGKSVQVNLSKVDYMDSSGISVLIEGKQLAEKKSTKFELIEVSKPVEKVLSMARKFL